MNKELRKVFYDKIKGGEKEVVAAFVEGNAEGALKTKPKVGLLYQNAVVDDIDRVPKRVSMQIIQISTY